MSRKRDRAGQPDADRAHGTLLAEENSFDRRTFLRLGGWSLAATSAVVLAMLVNQSSLKIRRDEIASADLALQARQVQMLSQQTMSDSKRLASAVETLSSDRDRLYSRVSTLEQGLDSVTGSIGRQAAAARQPVPAIEPPPPAMPVASAPPVEPQRPTPATPLMAAKSLMAPPEPSASRLDTPPLPVVASVQPAEAVTTAVAVPHTEFGIDLGIAPSVDGLRALWRQISTAHPALASLQPLIVVKERPGIGGMQLRLVAGPLRDASSAAQICAALPAGRLCEPATYDGQRLAMTGDASVAPPAPKPVRRKPVPKPAKPAEAVPVAPPPRASPASG